MKLLIIQFIAVKFNLCVKGFLLRVAEESKDHVSEKQRSKIKVRKSRALTSNIPGKTFWYWALWLFC